MKHASRRAGLFAALAAALFVVGVLACGAGLVALLTGQPYGIWYALVLCGVILGLGGGLLVFRLIPWVYGMAEARRQAAEALRAGL